MDIVSPPGVSILTFSLKLPIFFSLPNKRLLNLGGGPRCQSGNTLASHLWGRGSVHDSTSSGKTGSCLPLVSSLQNRTLTPTCMYWFPPPFQLPMVISPLQWWKRLKTPNKQTLHEVRDFYKFELRDIWSVILGVKCYLWSSSLLVAGFSDDNALCSKRFALLMIPVCCYSTKCWHTKWHFFNGSRFLWRNANHRCKVFNVYKWLSSKFLIQRQFYKDMAQM